MTPNPPLPGGATAAPAIAMPPSPPPRAEQLADRLGALLRERFKENERARQDVEKVWFQDLRQFKGIYDPEVEAKLKHRSKQFIRFTRTKVKSVDARVFDVLFPGGSDKNWQLDPTPVASIDPAREGPLIQQLAAQAALAKARALAPQGIAYPLPQVMQGIGMGQIPPDVQPPEAVVLKAVNALAHDACTAMSAEIDDQLTEINYVQICRDVMHSGHLYGTGILKGPLAETRTRRGWTFAQGLWRITNAPVQRPFAEFVPVWSFYPDMTVTDWRKTQGGFQRHVLSRYEVRGLARLAGFDAERLAAYLEAFPTGDLKAPKNHEQQLRDLSKDAHAAGNKQWDGKYELLEYWGLVDGFDLAEAGIEIPPDQVHMEFEASVWVLGTTTVKAILNPMESGARPYHLYYFEKDDTSIWGTSIPSVLRDTQTMLNAGTRMMLDNAAVSCGPSGEFNIHLVENIEDARQIYPFHLVARKGQGSDAQTPAIRFYEVPNYTAPLLNIVELAKQWGDETSTLPSYTHGEQDQGVSRTVGGLSMLMGASQITLKDIVRNFDQVTNSFLTGLYEWNMQFNPRDDLKGDFEVQARGSTSLVAKELYAQNLERFAASTLNPIDAPTIKRLALNRKRAEALDLPVDDIVLSDDEMQAASAPPVPLPGGPPGMSPGMSPGMVSGMAPAGPPGMAPAMMAPGQGPPGNGAGPPGPTPGVTPPAPQPGLPVQYATRR